MERTLEFLTTELIKSRAETAKRTEEWMELADQLLVAHTENEKLKREAREDKQAIRDLIEKNNELERVMATTGSKYTYIDRIIDNRKPIDKWQYSNLGDFRR